MSLTVTLNGTLGRTSSSQARRVEATLGVATGECNDSTYKTYTIRKNALDGTPDTTLPIDIALGFDVVKALIVRTVNSATVKLIYSPPDLPPAQEGDPPVAQPQQIVPLILGDDTHPEGLLTLFGEFTLMSLQIVAAGADGTEVEIWVAGT